MRNAKINSRIRTIFIKPGELVLVEEETLITTVLGSCVALVLHNARTGMAGLSHAMLPQSNTAKDGYHFVDRAFHHLLDQFIAAGISPDEIKTQLFGGADMFKEGQSQPGVGRKNIAAAHSILKHYNLKPAICNTGGLQSRKLIFYTESGLVQMNLLARQTEATTRKISREFPRVRQPLSTSSLHRHPE